MDEKEQKEAIRNELLRVSTTRSERKISHDSGKLRAAQEDSELRSYAAWINGRLTSADGLGDKLAHVLPLSEDGSDLCEKIKDGVLLCALVNVAAPDTIALSKIKSGEQLSTFEKHGNLTLAIDGAKKIGCRVVNMDSHVLSTGATNLVLGFIWNIIARFLFTGLTLENVPGLVKLLHEEETIEQLLKLPPKDILQKWINFQLAKTGYSRRIGNLSHDVRDCHVYIHLLRRIAPADAAIGKDALNERDWTKRAEVTLQEADKIGCRAFVTPKGISSGHPRLNLAFVANLFNKYPALEDDQEEVPPEDSETEEEVEEEVEEEEEEEPEPEPVIQVQPTVEKREAPKPPRPVPSHWHNGVFECTEEPKLCLFGCFCLPCLIWQSGNRLGEMAWFPFRCLACVVPCAPIATIRTKARAKYNIAGSRNDDLLYACFCAPCANCQISNELDSRLD